MSVVENYYDQHARDEWDRLGVRYRAEFKVTLRALVEFLPPSPADLVDIGGGPGRYAIALAQRGYRLTLVDLSSASLQLAEENAAQAGVRLEACIHANALDLSALPGAGFDSALLLGPLYHLHKLEERRQALEQTRRLVKPGGLVFASFITRFAAFRDAAVNGYTYVQDDPAYGERLLATGIHDNGEGFTDAYFARPEEVVPLGESAGFTTLRLMGCEGLLAGHEEHVNALTGAAHDLWLDLNYRFAQEPSLLGASDHLLYIGRNDAGEVGTDFRIEGPFLHRASDCIPILRMLPDWFGIESAILEYEREIEDLPTFLASVEEDVVGFLSLKRHYDHSAEIFVMAVRPEFHHRGLGRALIAAAEAHARGMGVEYMQVKTLAPSRTDENYAATRAFYQALGYRPLEEFPRIWDEDNPCLVLVKQI
jgi:S-adenosylmethionine-dependent methyltransferase